MKDKTNIDDDLYYDSDDRNYLLNLPEYEREKILYERYNKIMKLKEQHEYDERIKKIDREEIIESTSEDEIEFTEEDMKNIIVTRDFLAKNIYKTNFEKFIGHFVRINCINKYVIGLIDDVSRGDVYLLRFKHKNIKTDRHLKIKILDKEYQSVEIKNVSNSLPEEDEIIEFKKFFNKLDITKEYQFKKFREIEKYFNRPLTDAEITEYHKEKDKFQPCTKSRVKKKIELIAKRDKLIENRKFTEAEETQKEIDKLDDKEEDNVWATIHEKNRKANLLNARRKETKDKSKNEDIYNPCKRRSKYF